MPTHTHAYDLSSLVLAGSVHDIQYEEETGTAYRVYSVVYSGADSKIEITDRMLSAKKVVDEYHVAGEGYIVPVGRFHQTSVPVDKTALTLVVLSNFQDTKPLVLGEVAAHHAYPYDRTPFDRRRFWSAVEEAMGARD